MGKKKKVDKETVFAEKIIRDLQHKWAIKRSKIFPLQLADWRQWELERFIEQRYQQSKDLFNKSEEFCEPLKSVEKGFPFKFCPFLIYDGIVVQNECYKFMSETNTKKAIGTISDILNGTARNNENYTILSLLSKYQYSGDNLEEQGYSFKRAAIMISPSLEHTDYMCVRNEDEIAALLYAGLVTDDDKPQNTRIKGVLEFKDKNRMSFAVELEEFCVLAEIEENKEYIFTLYNRVQEILFTVTLSGLENVEFIMENGKVEVINKGEEVDDTKNDNAYIGQTFGRLTAIKPTGKIVIHGREWLFQCSCGNTVEAAFARVKCGHKKSCGCLHGGQLKDIAGQKFGRLTAIKRLERKNNSEPYLWECLCDCGGTTTATVAQLNFGQVKSCGCLQKEFYEKCKLNIKGQKFGRLTAIESIGRSDYGSSLWLFQCSCGKKTVANASLVKSGGISSCGCLRKEMAIERFNFADFQKNILLFEDTNVTLIASDKLNANNTSGVKGVHWDKNRQKWMANIFFQGNQHWLGAFNDKADAILARKMAEKKYFEPVIEKYMGTNRKPNSDSKKDIPKENSSSIATGDSANERQ